jgi:two-component system sensor histidine kinase CpxA
MVTASDDCTVSGAEDLLRSAIENVIRNGIRHTADGTVVEVSLRREGHRAVVRVRDQGPGVPETMLAEMFLPFRRVPTAHGTLNEGSGLGLAIAHRAVTATGGAIGARNGAGAGLIVEMEFPLTAADGPASRA